VRITPFCSCSAVPAFIGFVAAGVPIGVTLSFLIASPLVNEIAVGLLASLFGWRIAGLSIAAGLAVAITAGWVLGRLVVQRRVEPFVFETRPHGRVIDSTSDLTLDERLQLGLEEVRSILRRIWPYLLIGIGLGAVIHGWAPEDLFTEGNSNDHQNSRARVRQLQEPREPLTKSSPIWAWTPGPGEGHRTTPPSPDTGVMSTPALLIDEDVVMSGRVPTPAQIRRELLTSAAASS
jgi:hypothetical protein